MSVDIKRYLLNMDAYGHPTMEEDGDGPWIRHSDHIAEVESLRKLADEAAQKALDFAAKYDSVIQAITDPENQPSQYGTVTLSMHESLRKQWKRRIAT